jgi:hypothetical protein
MNHVEEILNRSKEIHLKKREDYASDPTANPFENFDRSSIIASWFPNRYKSFAVLIGTKIARLGALLITGKTPSNESIDDTFLDLITYCALFYGYWKERQLRESAAIEVGYEPIPDSDFQIPIDYGDVQI